MRAITSITGTGPRTGRLAATLAAATTVAGLAAAQAQVALPAPPPPARLGAVGQTVVTSELALDYQRDVTEAPGGDTVTTTTYDFHAGFDRVVWRQLTVGGRIGFSGELQGMDERKRTDFGARIGALVPAGGSRVWWPTVGMTYGLTSFGFRTGSDTMRTITLVAAGPMLWQPGRHLLIGLGPVYTHDLQSRTGPGDSVPAPTTRGFGVHGFLGLWF